MSFFSADYFESRDKFREAVNAAGGSLSSYEHTDATGPVGESLTVDVAVFGLLPAHRVFFNLNGVHGIEAYPGAAAQLQWIASGILKKLPNNVAVVLVHNLNPFGWSHNSQRNEGLYDLNRNFIDFDHVPDSDVKLHEALARAITFEKLSFAALDRAWQKSLVVAEEFGKSRFNEALMVGQYAEPRGLKYGGDRPSWSNLLLRDLAKEYLAQAEKVAIIDWHTGLGEYGQPYPLHTWTEGSESWQRTAMWWSEDAVRQGGQGMMTEGSEDGDATTSAVNGSALQALFDAAPDAQFSGGAIEFGTVPFNMIAQAAILDHWLMLDAPKPSLEARFWKAQIRTFFAPRDRWWESSVLGHAEGFYQRMLAGLIEW